MFVSCLTVIQSIQSIPKAPPLSYINIDSISLPFFSLSFFLGFEGTEAELIELIVQQFW